jgi:hypothetical protein
MASREIMTRLPILVCVGEAARIGTISIDWLVVNARLNIDALLAINRRCLMIVVMMLDDFTVDDRRPFVGLSIFRIRAEISGQCRASEPKKRCCHENEELHCILRLGTVLTKVARASLNGN